MKKFLQPYVQVRSDSLSLGLIYPSFSKVVYKSFCKWTELKNFQQVYKSLGSADFLHIYACMLQKRQSPVNDQALEINKLQFCIQLDKRSPFLALLLIH